MNVNKEKILPFLAIIIIMIGIGANLYVSGQQSMMKEQEGTLTINGEQVDIQYLLQTVSYKTIETDDGEKTGIPIEAIIQESSIPCPSCHSYTFVAIDGYQQTVEWENIQKGVFSDEHRVFFPGLAHAFWVRDVIEIKVE
jgi:hypothetical protein